MGNLKGTFPQIPRHIRCKCTTERRGETCITCTHESVMI